MDTVDVLLGEWAADAPGDVVVRERQGRQRTRSIGEVVAEAELRAAGLAALGVGPERAVIAWLPNRVEWIELLAAAARLGAPVVGLNPRYRSEELRHVLQRSAAAVLVTAAEQAGTPAADIVAAAHVDESLAIVLVDDVGPEWTAVPATVLGWPEVADRATSTRRHLVRSDDLLIAFTTSGTTGLPKLAVHDHAGVARHAVRDAAAFDVRVGDRQLLDLPLCGTFGFSSLLAAFAGRATTLLHERFVPEDSARAIATEGVTHYHGSDDMVQRILDTGLIPPTGHAWREGGFANFVNAGPAVCARAEAELGVRLTGLYGMSEVFALLSRWPSTMPAPERSRAGGIPVDDALTVRVVDPDTGAERAVGEDGELCFRGPQVLTRYLGDPAATARAFTADGWFCSGDLGRLTADGGFEYLARLGDSLRLRGFLVDPAEIERRLEQHLAVELAQVVGAERPGRGQVAVAFVKLRPAQSVSEDELRAHCAAGIADLKVPARVLTVDEFPAVDGPNGRKILKRELRDRAAHVVDPTRS